MSLRPVAVLAAGVIALAALSGCSAPAPAAGSVTVAVAEPFTSLNPLTSYGDTGVNNAVAHLTGTGFGYYDDDYRLVRDESFGKAEVISPDPFTVRYTIADSAKWSDGTTLDASDLMLAWAANSGKLNTPDFDDSSYVDAATGAYTKDFPAGTVFFDGSGDTGLQNTVGTPKVTSGGRALEVTYRGSFTDWPVALEPGLPAHVLGASALGETTPSAASAAVLDAVQKKDGSALAKLARAWNTAGNTQELPKDRGLLAASGPYRVSAIAKGVSVTLTANPDYHGDRAPHVKKIVLKTVADPSEAVNQLAAGTVDIATPQPSVEVAHKLVDLDNARVTQGAQGVFEHLDLQMAGSRSGVFDDRLVRQAFLRVVPRRAILDQVVVPIDADASLLQSFTLPPGRAAYAKTVETNGSRDYVTVDVAAARALLTQAGVTAPQVCILYDPSNPRRVEEYQLIKKSATPAGFQVSDCSSPDWNSLLGTSGAYDAALFSWDTTRLGTTAISDVFRSGAKLTNLNGFSDPKVDQLVDKLGTLDSADDQDAVLAKIDKRVWAAAYGVPLFQYPALVGVNTRVKNVTLSPLADGVFWNAWEWTAGSASATATPNG